VKVLVDARKVIGESPKVLLALGSALVAVEQYKDASQILAGLIQIAPGQFEAYPKLAEAYRNMGEPARATEALRQLAQRRPDDPMLQVAIARSLLDEAHIDYSLVLQLGRSARVDQ
jgi:predicted Zn-dependent protease